MKAIQLIFATLVLVAGCARRPTEFCESDADCAPLWTCNHSTDLCDPPPQVLVKGGTFNMGSTLDPSEEPIHSVTVASFFLDPTEVIVQAYERCVTAKKCKEEPRESFVDNMGRRQQCNWSTDVSTRRARYAHPVNCVSVAQAREYCESLKLRLPTEPEWEYAARGTMGSMFPWGGTSFSYSDVCRNGVGTCVIASHSCTLLGQAVSCQSGLADLAGNVWEITSTEWCEDYTGTRCGAMSKHKDSFVIRGGSWHAGDRGDDRYWRGSYRNYTADANPQEDTGFRCARSP